MAPSNRNPDTALTPYRVKLIRRVYRQFESRPFTIRDARLTRADLWKLKFVGAIQQQQQKGPHSKELSHWAITSRGADIAMRGMKTNPSYRPAASGRLGRVRGGKP